MDHHDNGFIWMNVEEKLLSSTNIYISSHSGVRKRCAFIQWGWNHSAKVISRVNTPEREEDTFTALTLWIIRPTTSLDANIICRSSEDVTFSLTMCHSNSYHNETFHNHLRNGWRRFWFLSLTFYSVKQRVLSPLVWHYSVWRCGKTQYKYIELILPCIFYLTHYVTVHLQTPHPGLLKHALLPNTHQLFSWSCQTSCLYLPSEMERLSE